jgi:hypothetical protein
MVAANATATRLFGGAGPADARIERAFRLVIGRTPSAKERALAWQFLEPASSRRQPSQIAVSKEVNLTPAALEELCRALFNLNAFVYVD